MPPMTQRQRSFPGASRYDRCVGGVAAIVIAVATLSFACGASDAGPEDAALGDAAPIDAPAPIDAGGWGDRYPTFYEPCDMGWPDCPPEHPFCAWTGCLECSGPRCVEQCVEAFVFCVETLPSDAESCYGTDDGPSCPAERPYCCDNSSVAVCVDRELIGWECSTPE